jgi:hypothetical protein
MSYTDVLSRITQLNSEISGLQTAFTPPSTTSPASTSPAPGASMTFSSALASAVNGASSTTATAAGAPSGMLTTGQQQFASRLAANTGLDTGVISAWMLAEESGGAATSRQSANNNDWLNIGYTDSGTYGAADGIWSSPTAAADATAGWLKGQNTIPGYGTASSGIQAVVATAGQPPAAQIAALQTSGWASSGYPNLPALYQHVIGG